MCEPSLVIAIIEIASKHLKNTGKGYIKEIELDIGRLNPVKMDVFEKVWNKNVQKTVLEKAVKKINRIEARASCTNCNIEFPVTDHSEICPVCGGYSIGVVQGQEFRIRRLVTN